MDLLMIHKDKNSRTLLHLAARKGCTILFKQMNELCYEKKTMLLKLQACNLHTPLHLAIVSNWKPPENPNIGSNDEPKARRIMSGYTINDVERSLAQSRSLTAATAKF